MIARTVLIAGILALGAGCSAEKGIEREVSAAVCVSKCFNLALGALNDIDHETPNVFDVSEACHLIHTAKPCCVVEGAGSHNGVLTWCSLDAQMKPTE